MLVENQDSSPPARAGSLISKTAKTAAELASEQPKKTEEQAAPVDDIDESENETEVSATEEDEQDSEPKKSKGGFQKRIDKLTKKASELERQLEVERADKERLLQLNKPKTQEKQPADNSGEPNPDNFETYAEYNKALVRYEAKLIRDEEKQQEAEQRTRSEMAEAGKNFEKKVELAKSKYDDFDEVFDPDLQVSGAMQAVMLDSDVGAELAYYLCKNPNEAAEIANMHPLQATRKMALIEAKLLKDSDDGEDSVVETKKISAAPKPVTPIKSGNGGVQKDPNKMNFKEYKAYRAAQKNR